MTTYLKNQKVRFDYELLDTFTAGISLLGTEVKAVRNQQGSLAGSFVVVRGGEAFLVGANIPPYQAVNAAADYDPERPRKLLLTKKELATLHQKSEQQGLTIVPIELYNAGRTIKLKLALVRGKKTRDKRETIKARDQERELARTLKHQ
jgi:SsrA-binding protein